ncbi:cytochrome-c peroxidase [Lacinutrix chionoecetis]
MSFPTLKLNKPLLYTLLATLTTFSCVNEAYYEDISPLDTELLSLLVEKSNGIGNDFFILPNSNDYASIPQDPNNPLNASKVSLGKMLVHETATGGDPKMESAEGTYSCASCHPVAAGFYSGNLQGIGEGGKGFGFNGDNRIMDSNMPVDSIDILPIKVPSLLNVAYQEVALWNGSLGGAGINAPFVSQNANEIPENLLGYQGLETQGIAGQTAHRLKIDEAFINDYGYKDMFDDAFPDFPVSERYSQITAGLAIAAFNRTLLANQSPWQNWLKRDYHELSTQEKRGAILFFDKAQCVSCHTGPALKSEAFYALGMGDIDQSNGTVNNPDDFALKRLGRGGFTNNSSDNFKFKVPNLYNLKSSTFYGHGGTFSTIHEVVTYIVNGEKENSNVPDSQLAEEFTNLNLTQQEINDVVAFVENALYDPNIERYVPTEVFSGNCIPNNDEQSQIDLGCN